MTRMSNSAKQFIGTVSRPQSKRAWEGGSCLTSELKVNEVQNNAVNKNGLCWKLRNPSAQKPNATVIAAWKPILIWWRILGIVPLQMQATKPRVSFSWKNFSSVRTGVLTLLFLVTFSISVLVFKDSMSGAATDVAEASINVLYYGYCAFTCAFFLHRGPRFAFVFNNWQTTEEVLMKYQLTDGLKVKCWILLGIMVTFSTVDNILYLLSKVRKGTGLSLVEVLENLADKNTRPYLGNYSYLYGALLFISESWGSFAWVVGDTCIMLSSVILRHYYEGFNKYLKKRRGSCVNAQELEEWRRSHFLISQMVDELDRIMAPLTLSCFATNVVYTLSTLYSGIVDSLTDPNLIVRSSFVFVFAFLLLRIVGSSHLAARIPEEVYLYGGVTERMNKLVSIIGQSHKRNTIADIDPWATYRNKPRINRAPYYRKSNIPVKKYVYRKPY